MTKYKSLIISGLAFIAIAMTATDALAISAWARKYNVSCNACHWGGYRLNRDGQKFLRTGHFYAGDKASTQLEDFLALNSKIRFNDANDANTTDNKVGDLTFEYHAFALYSGGLLTQNWSFFTEIYLHEREGNPTKVDGFGDGGRTKLAEAFLQYTRGGENYFTIRGGQIASQLWYLQGAGGRLSETRNYLVNNTGITTNAGLANTWLPRMRDVGVEIGGQYKDIHLAAGVINGNGNSPTNVIESKGLGAKDFYTSIDYTMKEMAQVGLFYHDGNLEDPTLLTSNKDDFYRVGLTFNANPSDKIWLLGSYLMGKDTDKLPKAGLNADVKSKGFAFEGDFLLNADRNIAPFVKYDWFTHDGKSGTAGDFDTTTNMFVVGCTFGLFEGQRGRITTEWQYLKTTENGPIADVDKVKDQNFRVELSFML